MPLLLVTMPGRSLKSNLSLPSVSSSWKCTFCDGAGLEPGDLRQRQIVGADHADRASLNQCPNQTLRADAPVRRIGSLQQFVQQKQQRQRRWARTAGAGA